MRPFDEDAYRERQLNKHLDNLEAGEATIARLENERDEKLEELFNEFEEMIGDINSEYPDLDKATALDVVIGETRGVDLLKYKRKFERAMREVQDEAA